MLVSLGRPNRMLKKATSGVLGRAASSRTRVRSGGSAPSGLAGGLFEHPVVTVRFFDWKNTFWKASIILFQHPAEVVFPQPVKRSWKS